MHILCSRSLGGRLLPSFLARDVQNAKSVWKASQGRSLIGISVRDHKDYGGARALSLAIREEYGVVSLNLGGGDSSQWQRVVELAQDVNPGHVNQVFPALGYTIGVLKANGLEDNVVNGVTLPSPAVGEVIVSTGPLSGTGPVASIPVEAASRLIREVGGLSLKVLGNCGKQTQLLAEIVKRAAAEGIGIFEPAGGIDETNIVDVVRSCMAGNEMLIIPHIHSSVIDPVTQKTDPSKVSRIMDLLTQALDAEKGGGNQ